jgi:hypothetical protein
LGDAFMNFSHIIDGFAEITGMFRGMPKRSREFMGLTVRSARPTFFVTG